MFEPLKFRNFRLLFTAQVFSDFGNWMEFIAIQVLLVYRWDLDATATAAYVFWICLPYVVLGPFIGVWTDMLDRRKIMVASDLLRMCLLISLIWVPNPTVLLVLAFIKGVLTTMFNTAKQGTVRQVVPDDSLLQATSLSLTCANLAKFIGPTLGGILIGLFSMNMVFVICALCYLLSALNLMRLPTLTTRTEGTGEQRSYLDELKFGVKFIVSSKTLLAITAFFIIEATAMFMFDPQISQLGSDAGFPEQQYSTFVSAVGIGSVVGAFLLSKWGKRVQLFTLPMIGTSILGPALLLLAGGHFGWLPITYPLWVVVFFIVGIGIGALGVCYGYLMQSSTPPEYMGRVFSTFESITYLGILVGTWLGGLLAQWYNVSLVFAIAGTVLFVLGFATRMLTSRMAISNDSKMVAS